MPTRLKSPEPHIPHERPWDPRSQLWPLLHRPTESTEPWGPGPAGLPWVESRCLWPGGKGRMMVLQARGGCPGAQHSPRSARRLLAVAPTPSALGQMLPSATRGCEAWGGREGPGRTLVHGRVLPHQGRGDGHSDPHPGLLAGGNDDVFGVGGDLVLVFCHHL